MEHFKKQNRFRTVLDKRKKAHQLKEKNGTPYYCITKLSQIDVRGTARQGIVPNFIIGFFFF